MKNRPQEADNDFQDISKALVERVGGAIGCAISLVDRSKLQRIFGPDGSTGRVAFSFFFGLMLIQEISNRTHEKTDPEKT